MLSRRARARSTPYRLGAILAAPTARGRTAAQACSAWDDRVARMLWVHDDVVRRAANEKPHVLDVCVGDVVWIRAVWVR